MHPWAENLELLEKNKKSLKNIDYILQYSACTYVEVRF